MCVFSMALAIKILNESDVKTFAILIGTGLASCDINTTVATLNTTVTT